MPRVKIDGQGVSIELDAGEASIAELGKQALQMYADAHAAKPKTIGFSHSPVDTDNAKDKT